MHNKCNALDSSPNHSQSVHGKIVFHKTGPWCQTARGSLLHHTQPLALWLVSVSSLFSLFRSNFSILSQTKHTHKQNKICVYTFCPAALCFSRGGMEYPLIPIPFPFTPNNTALFLKITLGLVPKK